MMLHKVALLPRGVAADYSDTACSVNYLTCSQYPGIAFAVGTLVPEDMIKLNHFQGHGCLIFA